MELKLSKSNKDKLDVYTKCIEKKSGISQLVAYGKEDFFIANKIPNEPRCNEIFNKDTDSLHTLYNDIQDMNRLQNPFIIVPTLVVAAVVVGPIIIINNIISKIFPSFSIENCLTNKKKEK